MQKMRLMYNSIGKWATDFNGKFIEEDIQMTNNHIPPSALGMDLVLSVSPTMKAGALTTWVTTVS